MLSEDRRRLYFDALHDCEKAVSNKRHDEIKHEMRIAEERFTAGLITKDELSKGLRALTDEILGYSVLFQSEQDFSDYFKGHPFIYEQFYVHEREHAQVYKKHGVPVLWGVHRLVRDGDIGFAPFIGPQFPNDMPMRRRLEIELESIEAVSQMSEHDEQDAESLRRILGR